MDAHRDDPLVRRPALYRLRVDAVRKPIEVPSLKILPDYFWEGQAPRQNLGRYGPIVRGHPEEGQEGTVGMSDHADGGIFVDEPANYPVQHLKRLEV